LQAVPCTLADPNHRSHAGSSASMGKPKPRPAHIKPAKDAGKCKTLRASKQVLRKPSSHIAVPAVQSATLASCSSYMYVYPDRANNVWKYFVHGECKGASANPGTAAQMARSIVPLGAHLLALSCACMLAFAFACFIRSLARWPFLRAHLQAAGLPANLLLA
jgi:hypothetical protein